MTAFSRDQHYLHYKAICRQASFLYDKLTLPNVCVYAQQFFMAGFSFFIDRTGGQVFTLPIFFYD